MAVTSFQREDGAADGGCRGCSKMKAREQQDAAQRSPVWTLRDQDVAFENALEKMPSATAPLEPSIGDTEEPYRSPPEHLHSLKHGSSVLALAVSSQNACIYAGTQDGEIVVWSLGYFEETKRVQAHKRSVLCLFLSPDESKLFSSAGDPIVSVWCPRTLARLYEIYSTYDVGDIFSVAYSSQRDTLYLGAQDTSIQCIKLSDESRLSSHDAARHPDRRNHRFFDSKAVGGASTPRRTDDRWSNIPRADKTLEIDSGAILRFAHYGYVYCMLMAKGPTMLVEPEEEVLISGGGDGTIKLWKLVDPADDSAADDDDSDGDESGIREIMVLGTDDAESVMSLAVDASFLYAGKLKGLIELWDLDTKQKLRVIKAHKGDVMTLQMRWGLLWSAASVGTATTHSTVHYGKYQNVHTANNVSQKYQCVRRWKAHHGKALASAVATYGSEKYYISGANDNDIAVWRVTDSAPLEESTDEASDDVLIASLREFVSYRTVSSRPEFAEDCRKGATYLGSLLKKLGGQVGMLSSDKPHNPVVYAKFSGKLEPADKRKRILFYGHYDVVAADTKNGKWQTDPFHAKGENGYLYGRGVSDNKGPILAALYATTDLMQAQKLDNDVIFLIEGEEESGSRGFEETVRKNKDLIGHIDYILLANSYWLDDEVPCLTYGLRGVLHATVCVDSDLPDLHSGVDGSAMMDEPLSDLTRILSSLKRQGNRVAIPGFYEHILPVTAEEEARYDEIARILVRRTPALRRSPEPEQRGGNDDADADADAARLKTSLMARWREPNLTIHRYKVSGPDGSLVSSHASANISFRLVPGQAVDRVAAMAVAFLEGEFAALESRNRLSVKIDNKAEPWLGDPTNGIFRTLEGAVMEAWADLFDQSGSGSGAEGRVSAASAARAEVTSARPRRPLYIREGGSIPAIRFLEKEFGAPAAHLPCGQASDSAHLDNERLRVVNLVKSREIFAKVFMRL